MPRYRIEPWDKPHANFEVEADSHEHAAEKGARQRYGRWEGMQVKRTSIKPIYTNGSRYFQAYGPEPHPKNLDYKFFVRLL